LTKRTVIQIYPHESFEVSGRTVKAAFIPVVKQHRYGPCIHAELVVDGLYVGTMRASKGVFETDNPWDVALALGFTYNPEDEEDWLQELLQPIAKRAAQWLLLT